MAKVSCSVSGEFLIDPTSKIFVVDPATQTLLGEASIDGREQVDVEVPDAHFAPSESECSIVVRALGMLVVPVDVSTNPTDTGASAELHGIRDAAYSDVPLESIFEMAERCFRTAFTARPPG